MGTKRHVSAGSCSLTCGALMILVLSSCAGQKASTQQAPGAKVDAAVMSDDEATTFNLVPGEKTAALKITAELKWEKGKSFKDFSKDAANIIKTSKDVLPWKEGDPQAQDYKDCQKTSKTPGERELCLTVENHVKECEGAGGTAKTLCIGPKLVFGGTCADVIGISAKDPATSKYPSDKAGYYIGGQGDDEYHKCTLIVQLSCSPKPKDVPTQQPVVEPTIQSSAQPAVGPDSQIYDSGATGADYVTFGSPSVADGESDSQAQPAKIATPEL